MEQEAEAAEQFQKWLAESHNGYAWFATRWALGQAFLAGYRASATRHQSMIEGLAKRVADQAELLTRKAERKSKWKWLSDWWRAG